jgi:hypothetical protein
VTGSVDPLPLSLPEQIAAIRTVEREMEVAPRPVPAGAVAGVVAAVREPATATLAAKVLLVVLLEEGNRETAVEAGAASVAVEAGAKRQCCLAGPFCSAIRISCYPMTEFRSRSPTR